MVRVEEGIDAGKAIISGCVKSTRRSIRSKKLIPPLQRRAFSAGGFTMLMNEYLLFLLLRLHC